jgi:hypothetical protein
MSSLIILRDADRVHWYAKDGTPRHDATLREARKENLYPSVTSILAIKERPQLAMWKTRQLVEQALTVSRLPDESDESWWERVLCADAEERAKAPDLGTDVHAQLADYIRSVEKNPRVPGVDLGPVIGWTNEHVALGGFGNIVEASFSSGCYGYGGCIDYDGAVDGGPALIDWKTQSVKLNNKGKPAPVFYDEWAWQLSAYLHNFLGVNWQDSRTLYSVIIDTAAPGCYVKQWSKEDAERGWKGFQGLFEAWKADRKYNPLE